MNYKTVFYYIVIGLKTAYYNVQVRVGRLVNIEKVTTDETYQEHRHTHSPRTNARRP